MDIQPVAEMTPAFADSCDRLGDARQTYALVHGLKDADNLVCDYRRRFELHRLGARGEGCLHLLMPHAIWHRHTAYVAGAADFSWFIEAKAPDQVPGELPRHLICAKRLIKDERAYVLMLPLGKRRVKFQCMGWIWGWQFRDSEPPDWMKPYLRVDDACMAPTVPPLYPIKDLILIESWRRDRGRASYSDYSGDRY
jgi:hypothetical protein